MERDVIQRGRYIEASKTRIGSFASSDGHDAEQRAQTARRTLVYVFDTCLRLLHPFMPYVTEALWQQLPRSGEALMVASWPKVDEQALPVDTAAVNRCFSITLGNLARSSSSIPNNPQCAIISSFSLKNMPFPLFVSSVVAHGMVTRVDISAVHGRKLILYRP